VTRRPMRQWERALIQCVLALYPGAFRRGQRDALMQTYTDVLQARGSGVGTWLWLLRDAGATSLRIRFEAALRGNRSREETTMGWTWMDGLRHDLVFAFRTLRKSPAMTAAAVLTLGVGIGATTAVFSVVKGVILDPLPFEEPDRLVQVWTRYLPPSGFDIAQFPISGPEILDYRDQNRSFASLGYYSTGSRDLTGEGAEPQRIRTVFVSHRVLPTLGVEPMLGRWIRPEEDLPGAGNVVLLTHDLWAARFGSDPDIVGRTISISGRTALVAGVMPAGFAFPDARYQLIENMGLDETDPGGRAAHWLRGIGRLRPGVGLDHVRAEAEGIHAGWAEQYPHNVAHFPIFHRLSDDVVGGSVRQTLTLLMSAVVVVLLIAVVNVANLLMARGESRQAEMAVRNAIGAGPARLVRQLLTESLTLAMMGSVLGLAIARWGTAALLRSAPATLPRSGEVGMDAGVLIFSAAVTVAAALLFGLAPALQAGRAPAAALGGERSGTASGGRRRYRQVLVSAEVGLSVVVVLAAGLIVRSYRELTAVDPGVRVAGMLTFQLNLPRARYPEDAAAGLFFDELRTRLEALPGVRAASAASRLPLSGDAGRSDFRIEGRSVPADGERMWNAEWSVVLPGYFRTAGIRVLSGRTFTAADGPDSEPVVVIGRQTAELFFAGEDPLGARIAIQSDNPVWARIVGVVEGTRTSSLDGELWPQAYVAQGQAARVYFAPRVMGYTVQTDLAPERLVPAIRAAVAELDGDLPLASVRTMDQAFRDAVARPRLLTRLLGAFAFIALLLAGVGIYGVVSYSVARRTREMGIRLALGAEVRQLSRLLIMEGTWPALLGVGLGLPLAVASSGLVAGLLYGVSARDPLTFGVVPLILILVALASSYLPARRATGMAPSTALREE
jgi:putative ABC transport system permease protein